MKTQHNHFTKKIKSEEGVVLITVIILSLVALITVISILSLNVSQVGVSEAEVKNINSEIIAQGALARAHALLDTNPDGSGFPINYTDTVTYGNPPATINYTVTVSLIDNNSGPNLEDQISINIVY